MKNIFIMFIIFFCSNCKIEAQQKITVSAFYSDYVAKYDKLPDPRWSNNLFVQVRIKHEFEKYGESVDYKFQRNHFITDLVPGFVFSNFTLKKNQDLFRPLLTSELTQIINNMQDGPVELSYTFDIPAAFGTKYPAQSFYALPNIQSWFLSDKNNKDTITVIFDIDTSLFYIRCSKPISYIDDKPSFKFTYNEKEPSFYLFYLPAYKHFTIQDENRSIDLLVDNIDSARSCHRSTIEYYENNPVRDSLTILRLRQAISALDGAFGKNVSPDSLYIVKSPQSEKITMGQVVREFTTSWAHLHNKYSLFLIDNELFETHGLMHELMHGYVKTFMVDDEYEHNFFKESLVEYLTAYLYETVFRESVYKDKQDRMLLNEKTKEKAHKLLKISKVNALSFEGKEYDTSWIYYDLLPCRLHEYAERNGNEERFVETIISYMKKLDENHAPSFKEFSEYMKENGFKKMNNVYNF